MEIFINETSLNNQFNDEYSFFTAVKTFLTSIKFIGELKQQKQIFKSDSFFYFSGIKGTFLETTLKKNAEINSRFFENLQRINPKSWNSSQMHDPQSSYNYLDQLYVNTTVAEIAERKLVMEKMKGFLLNFSNSQFGNSPCIEVIKNNKEKIAIDCNVHTESINQWLIANGFIENQKPYDENSEASPEDYQTVVGDKNLFELTTYRKNNGRDVYRRIGTSQLWTVDGSKKHATAKAHIEVFDENTRKHLGTSLYNKIELDTSFKRNRKIEL